MGDRGRSNASGLEITFRCPRCGPLATLTEVQNAVGENRCPVCAGSLLPGYGLDRILGDILGISRLDLSSATQLTERTITRCPSCGVIAEPVSVAFVDADLCRRCGSAWFPDGGLYALSSGRYGARPGSGLSADSARAPRAHPVSSKPPPRRTLRFMLAIGLGVLLGTTAFFTWAQLNPGEVPFLENLRSMIHVEADAPSEASDGEPPHLPSKEDAFAIESLPFGGRPAAWWSQRLSELKTQTDERAKALYELTKIRAARCGLEVEEQGSTVTVRPSKTLLKQIGTRLETK